MVVTLITFPPPLFPLKLTSKASYSESACYIFRFWQGFVTLCAKFHTTLPTMAHLAHCCIYGGFLLTVDPRLMVIRPSSILIQQIIKHGLVKVPLQFSFQHEGAERLWFHRFPSPSGKHILLSKI